MPGEKEVAAVTAAASRELLPHSPPALLPNPAVSSNKTRALPAAAKRFSAAALLPLLVCFVLEEEERERAVSVVEVEVEKKSSIASSAFFFFLSSLPKQTLLRN